MNLMRAASRNDMKLLLMFALSLLPVVRPGLISASTLAPAAAFDVQACYRGCRGNQQCQENCENRQFEGQRPASNTEQCTVRNGRRECVTKLVPADD